MSSRHWCVTNWGENGWGMDDENEDFKSKVDYYILGIEYGERLGGLHEQIYIEFNVKIRWTQVLKLTGCTHVGMRRGTREQARDYCKLDGWYYEWGTWHENHQGERTDFQRVRDMIKEGYNMRGIIEESSSYQSLRSAEMILKYTEEKRWTETKIHYYTYGHMPRDKDAYYVTDINNWAGYDGQKTVIFPQRHNMDKGWDELRSNLGGDYPFMVNCKFGARQFVATDVWILSDRDFVPKVEGNTEDLDFYINEEL